MKFQTKLVLILVVLGILGIVGYKYLSPYIEEKQDRESSDASRTKGTITIGMDNWVGYMPLCSPEMRKRMRQSGYILECKDDKANYPERMQLLKKGKLNFAVATVDSYLLNGHSVNYPGTIVTVIDESKGGDAIVAWSDKIKNIEDLKKKNDYKIALTPASPSEHLLKTVSVHFDIPNIRNNKSVIVEADGSSAALEMLLKKKVGVAVLWEPDVSKALSQKGIKKLLGTEQTDKLIVDILIVNRRFADDDPDAVNTLLTNYYRVLKYYKTNKSQLIEDAADYTDLSKKKVTTLLKGVKWNSLIENAQQWFGVASTGSVNEEALIDTIESVSNVLTDSGDFTDTPVPGNDPYRLTNSSFVNALYQKSYSSTQFGATSQSSQTQQIYGLDRVFTALSKQGWAKLKEIGTLRIRPIIFQSGTDYLTLEGKEQLDLAAENLKHYPHFRLWVKGHTSKRGDAAANKKLSKARAEAIQRYLEVTYSIDPNRMLAQGHGGSKPLPRKNGESFRAYNYRLSRVEIALVAEDL